MLDYLFPDMRQRNTRDKERMDRQDADLGQLLRTIRQFKAINLFFSSSRRLLRRYFFPLMEQEPQRIYTLLDVGAGGCDIALWAAREARKRGLKLEITALDNDARILPLAREAVRGYPEIRIFEGNALDLSHLGCFDFVFSNHFLHHLDWDEIRHLFGQIIAQTRLAFVMNDLKRSRLAYLGCTIFIGLLARKSFAFYDGRLSIRRGFLPVELRDFVTANFPDRGIQVRETAPQRVFLLYLPSYGVHLEKDQT